MDFAPEAVLNSLFPGEVVAVQRLPGASGTASWQVDTTGCRYAVKLYPDAAPATGQAALLGMLSQAGLPVPPTHVRHIDSAFALVSTWAPGTTLAAALQDAPQQARNLGWAFGQAHAALHAVSLSVQAQAELPRLPGVAGQGQAALHLDYHPLNVLVVGQTVSAIIDWENVHIGDARADVARTISVLSVDPGILALPSPVRTALRRLRRAYMSGYHAAGGRVDGLAPFLAWAGLFLQLDLAGRVDSAALDPARRWTRWWANTGTRHG